MSDGVWVKVHPDDAGGDGLEGLGGWAEITAMTGDPKRYDYEADGVEWTAFEWTADGDLTTDSGGLVEALLIGGASGQFQTNGCSAGRANEGLMIVGVSENVKIGQGSAFNRRGGETKFANKTTGVVGASPGNNDTVGAGGSDSGTVNVGYIDPYTSSIRKGTPETYGAAWHPTAFDISSSTGFGDGKGSQAGVVIVRVPKDKVTATGGWV